MSGLRIEPRTTACQAGVLTTTIPVHGSVCIHSASYSASIHSTLMFISVAIANLFVSIVNGDVFDSCGVIHDLVCDVLFIVLSVLSLSFYQCIASAFVFKLPILRSYTQ